MHGTYLGTSYGRSYGPDGSPPTGTAEHLVLGALPRLSLTSPSETLTGPSPRLISNKIFAAAGLASVVSKDAISATHVFWYVFSPPASVFNDQANVPLNLF